MDNLNDKYQLEQVRTGMPYNELIDAVKRNFSILLNAYITGANVVEFTGMPGIPGEPGKRGASMFAINQQNLFKAMSVYTGNLYPITEDNVMSSVSNLETAVQALLTQSVSAAELFKGIPNIQSVQDIVQYDSILFNNGYLLTLTYTGQGTSKQFSVTGDILTVLAGGGASSGSTGNYDIDTIVQKVLEHVSISANGIGGVTAVEKQIQYDGAYRKSYMPKPVLPDAPTARTLAFLAANTASDIKNVVLIAGTNEQLKQVYTALNMALDDTNADTIAKGSMPIANFAPSLIVAQSAHGEKTAEPTSYDDAVSIPKQRFGMTIVNMDDIVANVDGNVSDGVSWSSFATISKAHDGLWLMSQSDDSQYGKIYLSKTRFELMLLGIFRLQAKLLKLTVSDGITVTNSGTTAITAEGKTTMSLNDIDMQIKGATSIAATTDNFSFALKSAYGNSQVTFTNNNLQTYATFKRDITTMAEADATFVCQGNYFGTYSAHASLRYNTLSTTVTNGYTEQISGNRTVIVENSESDKESIHANKIERKFLGNDKNDERVRLVYVQNAQAEQDMLTFDMPAGYILVSYDRIHLSGNSITSDALNLDITGDTKISVANYAIKASKWSTIATGDATLQANNLNIKSTAKLDTYANELSVQVKALMGVKHFPMFDTAGKLTYLLDSDFVQQLKPAMVLPTNFAPTLVNDRSYVVTLSPGETYDKAFADIAAKFNQLGKITKDRLASTDRVFAEIPDVTSTILELTDIDEHGRRPRTVFANNNVTNIRFADGSNPRTDFIDEHGSIVQPTDEQKRNPRVEFTNEQSNGIYSANGLAISAVTKKSDNSDIETFTAVDMTRLRTSFYDKASSRDSYPNQPATNTVMYIDYGSLSGSSKVVVNRLLKAYAPMYVHGICLAPTFTSDSMTVFLSVNHSFVIHTDKGTPRSASVVLPAANDIRQLSTRAEQYRISPIIMFANMSTEYLNISVQNTAIDSITDGRNTTTSIMLAANEKIMLVNIDAAVAATWLILRFN